MTHADLHVPADGRPAAGRPAAGAPASSALARCVADPDAFGAEHWGRAPLLTRAADRGAGPDAFRDVLDLDGVDELLSRRGLRTPFIRMAKAGQVLDSSAFTAPGGVGAEIGDQVRDDKVAALFADGATVVLQALHRTWPSVIDLCTRLGAELGHPVQANAYVTPPSSRGFSAHYDVHDVFVMQLAGRKHWTIHAPVLPDPLRTQPWGQRGAAVAAAARDTEPAIDTVLEPGDVLYLPRGWLHAATALGGVSAHLTVGVHVVTRFALVEALTALVADDPELRATLPLGLDVADPEALAPHVDAVRTAFAAALARVPADAVARRVRRQVWTGARPEPVGVLAVTAFAAGLAAGDAVRLRGGLRHRLRRTGDATGGRVVLELPDREVGFPARTEPALRALLGGDAVAVGSLPGMEDDDQVVLVRRLLREGVLVPAGRP
ncbi:MAG TPA: cupin domain-containing protein [Pseudonocardia sp.]